MQVIRANKILRHQLPFRFIDKVITWSDGRAIARVSPPSSSVAWAAAPDLSALAIEYAAQVMGVLVRSRTVHETSDGAPHRPSLGSGVLAGVSSFDWLGLPCAIASVEVIMQGARGAYYDFSAEYIDREGAVCARMQGYLHISLKPNLAPVLTGNTTVPASLQGSPQRGQAGPLYEVLACRRLEDGIEIDIRTLAECPVYAGHFPGAPITPGVLIAEMMFAAAQRLHSMPLALCSLQNLVFKAPLGPGQKATLRVTSGAGLIFSAVLFAGRKRLARAQFTLCAAQTETLNTPFSLFVQTQ